MILRILLPFLCVLLLTVDSIAQDNRYTEDEIKIQEKFIAAYSASLLGEYEDANTQFEALKKEAPQNDMVFYQLAKVQQALGDDIKAFESVERAVALNDKVEVYWELYATVAAKQNNEPLAAKGYQRLTSISPRNRKYYYKEAFHLVRSNKVEEALNVYNKLENQFGVEEETTRRKHTLLLGQGKLKEAGLELEQLTAAFPENTNYLELLASFYEQSKQPKLAKKAYQRLLELDPTHAKATIALTQKKKGSGEIAYLESLVPTFGDPAGALDAKIEVLFPYIRKVGVSQDAELSTAVQRLASLLVESHPEEAKAFAIQGDIAYHANDLELAKEAYQKTLAINPNVLSVWEQLMDLSFDMGDNALLLKTSEEALDLYPSQASVFIKYGIGLLFDKQFNESIQIFNEASMMAARSKQKMQELKSWKAIALLKNNKPAKATEEIASAMAIGNSVLTTCLKAQIDLETKGVKQAKESLKKVEDQFPTNKFVLFAKALIAKSENDSKELDRILTLLKGEHGYLHLQAQELEL